LVISVWPSFTPWMITPTPAKLLKLAKLSKKFNQISTW
jgi:hypothetical protein